VNGENYKTRIFYIGYSSPSKDGVLYHGHGTYGNATRMEAEKRMEKLAIHSYWKAIT
jgi:hypothetical protein